MTQARWLRDQNEKELLEKLSVKQPAGYSRKRLIPKLRYLSGQLAYLASPKSLLELGRGLDAYSETHLHAAVLTAVATENLDGVLPLGTNAAQAAAQPLRAAGARCKISATATDQAALQSLAVFTLNGVQVDRSNNTDNSELLRFAGEGASLELMRSGDPFTRELACLHGISEKARHPAMLESVFDEDERLAMDTVEQLQESASQ